MSAYLTRAQIVAQASEVTTELQRLLATKRLVMRPQSKQWAFLRHCLSVVLDGVSSDFPCTKQQALQYRFEADDKLSRYYLSPGRPVPFVFRCIHIDRARSMGLADDAYPSANGYVLLVAEQGSDAARTGDDAGKDIFERVVTEATDAEWAVYGNLPEVDLRPLERSFLVGGPAHKRIQHLAERHHERRWTITEPVNNPSTKRVLDVRVVKVQPEQAEIRTREYWYLRWWDLSKSDYAKIDYRETNTQTYILLRRDGRWLVEQNIYPPPRSSTPHRKGIVIG